MVYILFGLLIVVIIVGFAILLNPYFWQGLRNSKFIDELKRMDKDKLVKP